MIVVISLIGLTCDLSSHQLLTRLQYQEFTSICGVGLGFNQKAVGYLYTLHVTIHQWHILLVQ